MGHCYDVNYDDGKYVSGTYKTGLFLDIEIFFLQIFESFKILKGFASTDWKVHFPAQCNIHLIHTHYATTVITKKLWNRKTTL